MSSSWKAGSTRRWRHIRAAVLQRDGHQCQLRLPGCTTTATQVHHTLGRAATGDDIAYLVAACQPCNLRVGDPARHNPQPRPLTRW